MSENLIQKNDIKLKSKQCLLAFLPLTKVNNLLFFDRNT